jgi:hypothetical protein
MTAGTAGRKEKNGDERCQQDQRKITSLSVGQGEPPARVVNSYSQFGKENFEEHINDPNENKGIAVIDSGLFVSVVDFVRDDL